MTCRTAAMFIVIVLMGVADGRAAESPKTLLVLPSGTRLRAEVMNTAESRARGLMFRDSMKPDAALLFVFPKPGPYGFWMKSCRFPIDIVWLDEKRHVVDIVPGAPPCPGEYCPIYTPSRASLYVVEFLAGTAAREGVVLGARIRFTLEPSDAGKP